MANLAGLPPGPPLPAFVQTFVYATRPAAFLEHCAHRFGDCFSIHTYAFGEEVCVTHPDAVRQIFTGDPDQLRAGEANAPLEPLVGRRSVLLLDGAPHLRMRRLMMPPFHGERMAAYAGIMRSITEDVVASMPVGRVVKLHAYTQRITIEIILRAIFGLEEGAHLEELRDALTSILDRQASFIGTAGTLPPLRYELFGLSPWGTFVRARERADALIHRQIARRRAESAAGGGEKHDVLALLLSARDEQGQPMTDDELRDELMTLLAAGHETTATALCWAFDLALADRKAHETLREEIAGAGRGDVPDAAALGKLDYLDAVIKESLRLQPVIPAVGRKTRAPLEIGGRHVPSGVQLVPVTYLTHRRPDVYDDPLAFKPERFLHEKPNPYTWYPFGGGIRRCIGMAFALYEMKVVMATILARVRLRKARLEPERVRLRSFTHAPEAGAEVVVEARLGGSARATRRAQAPVVGLA